MEIHSATVKDERLLKPAIGNEADIFFPLFFAGW
jgi:hypothetical protein